MNKKYFRNTPDNILCNNLTYSILQKFDAMEFHKSLPEYKPTPLQQLPNLAKKYDVGNIYVKDESSRFGLNAFKVLGASYAISQTLKKDPTIELFCTATDGNHGKAVAWAAKRFNKKSIVFVPGDTTPTRINAIEKQGALVIQIKGNYDEACKQALNKANLNNWTLIQDTSWYGYIEIPALIMAGYLTMFKEIDNSLNVGSEQNIDVVFLQAGVGSMAASAVYYYLQKHGIKRPKIVLVEPDEADCILLSFKKNKISTSMGNSKTIMAGLNCETPSVGAWNLLSSGADFSIKIPDKYVIDAIRELYYPIGKDERIISGESGAAGLAGFLAVLNDPKLKPIRKSLNLNKSSNMLFISTEGATDQNIFNQIVTNKTEQYAE